MLEPKKGCKQVKARSGWCVIAGSHPVDGWPCDNLTHQPPSPLCVQLHKRINKRTHNNSRPVLWKGDPAQLRMRHSLYVIAVAMSEPVLLFFLTMLCCPDFNNLQKRVFFLSKLVQSCFFIILWLDEIWICLHGNHHIWFLFTCCHAPSIPITRHYNHQ